MLMPLDPAEVLYTSEHQVDDVLCKILIPARDEYLAAYDGIRAVRVPIALVSRAPTSLPACGSVKHMVPPLARGHLCHVLRFLSVGAEFLQQRPGGHDRKARDSHEAEIRGCE